MEGVTLVEVTGEMEEISVEDLVVAREAMAEEEILVETKEDLARVEAAAAAAMARLARGTRGVQGVHTWDQRPI